MFRKSLLKFIRSVEGKTYHINNSVAVKLLARLRLSFSHLSEHKFSSNFKDMLNPFFLIVSCAATSIWKTEPSQNDLENQSLPALNEMNLVDLL